MEELLLGAGKYVAGALGALVFMFIIDMLVLRDKTGDKERDKRDACNGILRGQEATNFHNMVEATNKEVRRQEAERKVITTYVACLDNNRNGWCVFKEKSFSTTMEFYSGPHLSMEAALKIAFNLNE